jgi:hypothetical protein
MGLCRSKVQSISMGFYILPEQTIKKHQRFKRKDTYKKREEKKGGKYLLRSIEYLVLDSGAYVIRKEEKNH